MKAGLRMRRASVAQFARKATSALLNQARYATKRLARRSWRCYLLVYRMSLCARVISSAALLARTDLRLSSKASRTTQLQLQTTKYQQTKLNFLQGIRSHLALFSRAILALLVRLDINLILKRASIASSITLFHKETNKRNEEAKKQRSNLSRAQKVLPFRGELNSLALLVKDRRKKY